MVCFCAFACSSGGPRRAATAQADTSSNRARVLAVACLRGPLASMPSLWSCLMGGSGKCGDRDSADPAQPWPEAPQAIRPAVQVPAVEVAVTFRLREAGSWLASRAVSAYAPLMQPGRTDKARFAARARGFDAFARWEAAHPSSSRSLESLLADIDALLRLMPEADRRLDPDATKSGVRRMHAALAVLRRGRAT
jgi:hypothetical protein